MREIADLNYAVAFYRNIGDVSGAPGAVHDAAVFDQDIELRCLEPQINTDHKYGFKYQEIYSFDWDRGACRCRIFQRRDNDS
jgi:hypothetical protein